MGCEGEESERDDVGGQHFDGFGMYAVRGVDVKDLDDGIIGGYTEISLQGGEERVYDVGEIRSDGKNERDEVP